MIFPCLNQKANKSQSPKATWVDQVQEAKRRETQRPKGSNLKDKTTRRHMVQARPCLWGFTMAIWSRYLSVAPTQIVSTIVMVHCSHWSRSAQKRRRKKTKVNLYIFRSPLSHQGKSLFTLWFILLPLSHHSFSFQLLTWSSEWDSPISTSMLFLFRKFATRFITNPTLNIVCINKIFDNLSRLYYWTFLISWYENGFVDGPNCSVMYYKLQKQNKTKIFM